MKYFTIMKITHDHFNEFVKFTNDHPDENWGIVLDSVGGQSALMKIIVEIINSRPDKVKIYCNNAYSAAFEILWNVKCDIYFSDFTKGCVHLPKAEMFIMSNNKPAYYEDECIVKGWKENGDDVSHYKKFLTKKEWKKIKKGDDIFFTYKRMRKIFPNSKYF